jgi:hypothetical protein
MRFPRVFTSVLALGCAAAHAIKSSEVTAAVKDLADTSNELRIKVETITFLNAPSQGVVRTLPYRFVQYPIRC